MQGKEYNFNYEFDPVPDYHEQDSLGFGGVYIYFFWKKLNLRGSVGRSTTTYVCEFNVTYKFDNARMNLLRIKLKVKLIDYRD